MTAPRYICTCAALPLPHPWKSGACDGWEAVETVWSEQDDGYPCRQCEHYGIGYHGGYCGLLHSKLEPDECIGLEFILKKETENGINILEE